MSAPTRAYFATSGRRRPAGLGRGHHPSTYGMRCTRAALNGPGDEIKYKDNTLTSRACIGALHLRPRRGRAGAVPLPGHCDCAWWSRLGGVRGTLAVQRLLLHSAPGPSEPTGMPCVSRLRICTTPLKRAGQIWTAAHPGVRALGARTVHSNDAATLPHRLEPSGGLFEKHGCSSQILTRRTEDCGATRPGPG
jgi:hypothetical protein